MNKKAAQIYGFYERLNYIMRIENDMRVTELAKKIGVDRKTIHSWLSGDRQPNSNYLAKICVIFNVSADWMLGISSKKELSK